MRFKLWLALAAVLALAATMAACGDDSSDSDNGGTTSEEFAAPTEAPDGAQDGGELSMLASGDVDYIDPGAMYYQFSFTVAYATQRPLTSYAPADIEQPTPDLAVEAPEVSEDGLTITYKIHDNVMYSPPVDREVVAADVEYALERSLLPGVPNGFVQTYLSDVVGLADAVKEAQANPTGGAPDVKGITAVDDTTLEIKLEESSSIGVIGALSLPVSAPVPPEYAEEFDAENPSTYGENQVATGPYMIENDPATGELTGYSPGKEIHLIRNPNWDGDATGDYRPAYLDEVTIQEGFADTVSASKKILAGDAQVNGDFTTPPSAIKQAVEEGEEGQLTVTPGGGNRYVALNTQVPPFDDIDVRKAVVANSNRTDLRNTRGGELTGPVATHFIPPDFPGFEEAGGLEGTGLDFVANPEGDPELAAEYMKAAGYDSGKCEGPECEITVIGEDAPPDSDTAEVAADQLEELGFDVTLQKVAADIAYTRFCSVPENSPEVCPNVGWLKDFNDGQSILDPTFNGESILPENNVNWPQLDVPEINDAINEATLTVDLEERNQAWGDVDTQIMEQAPAIPYIWDDQANIQSADVAGVINKANAQWDLSFTSLK